jgi:hypothetical protein
MFNDWLGASKALDSWPDEFEYEVAELNASPEANGSIAWPFFGAELLFRGPGLRTSYSFQLLRFTFTIFASGLVCRLTVLRVDLRTATGTPEAAPFRGSIQGRNKIKQK